MNLSAAYKELDDCLGSFCAARDALAFFQESASAEPGLMLNRDFKERHVQQARQDLEATYFIRLFACFEGILRDYWRIGLKRPTEPEMKDLINAIASKQHIQADVILEAHQVRMQKNGIVHPGYIK
jgi:hypothetical protein